MNLCGIARAAVCGSLCALFSLSGASAMAGGIGPQLSSGSGLPTTQGYVDPALVYPNIIAGDPNGVPPVTPSSLVDPNVPTSPFAGVVSINSNGGPGSFIGSGTLISSQYIITAAHVVDTSGDGVADFTPGQVRVFFNNNNPTNNLAGSTGIFASQIIIHPNFTGFNNPFINDDIAILKLSSPAPAGVPIYPLSNSAFNFTEDIVLAGYGTSGDGISGGTVSPNFFIKRSGENLASRFGLDDEAPNTAKEIFFFDFDGPTAATDTFNDGLTFGNDKEVTIAGGDSGGPSFSWLDTNNNTIVESNELTLFGVNTFGQSGGGFTSPLFGSQAGGMLVSGYLPFIQATVPEPASWAMLATAGVFLLGWQGRRRHRARA